MQWEQGRGNKTEIIGQNASERAIKGYDVFPTARHLRARANAGNRHCTEQVPLA
jgi:hypothetical protein